MLKQTAFTSGLTMRIKASFVTDLVHHFNHLLYFIGADVRTVCETEVDEDPLAEEILTFTGLFVVINKREGTTQRRPPD